MCLTTRSLASQLAPLPLSRVLAARLSVCLPLAHSPITLLHVCLPLAHLPATFLLLFLSLLLLCSLPLLVNEDPLKYQENKVASIA